MSGTKSIIANSSPINPNKGKTSNNFLFNNDEDEFIKVKNIRDLNFESIRLHNSIANINVDKFCVIPFHGVLFNKDLAYLVYKYEPDLGYFGLKDHEKSLGKFIAKIHIQSCTEIYSQKYENQYQQYYSNLIKYKNLKKSYSHLYLIDYSYDLRENIFESIKNSLDFNISQLLIHKDISMFNFVNDLNGKKHYLIDFDFARIADISQDLITILYETIKYYSVYSAAKILYSYIKYCFEMNFYPIANVNSGKFSSFSYNKDIEYTCKSILISCIGYLCTNNFPYYMYDKLSTENFRFLVESRNEKLQFLNYYYHQIYDNVVELKNNEN